MGSIEKQYGYNPLVKVISGSKIREAVSKAWPPENKIPEDRIKEVKIKLHEDSSGLIQDESGIYLQDGSRYLIQDDFFLKTLSCFSDNQEEYYAATWALPSDDCGDNIDIEEYDLHILFLKKIPDDVNPSSAYHLLRCIGDIEMGLFSQTVEYVGRLFEKGKICNILIETLLNSQSVDYIKDLCLYKYNSTTRYNYYIAQYLIDNNDNRIEVEKIKKILMILVKKIEFPVPYYSRIIDEYLMNGSKEITMNPERATDTLGNLPGPTDLIYTDDTKNALIHTQAGDKVTLEEYLNDGYRALFASHTGYEKPRNLREYNMMLSYLLLVANGKAENADIIFKTLFSL